MGNRKVQSESKGNVQRRHYRGRAKRWLAGIIVFTAIYAFAATLHAQSTVTVTPASLTVASSGDGLETRTLLIHTTTPITDLQAIPLDLTRTDGTVVLPSTALQVKLPSDTIAANGVLTIPIQINLADVPRGEFSGQLWLNYHSGALGIPLIVRVKDPWPLPVLVLVIGLGLGMALSFYRTSGKARDEVLVRAAQLRTQIRADADLAKVAAKAFKTRLDNSLMDVEIALQTANYAAAQQAIGQAETLWNKWFRGRDDWLAQMDYYGELMQKVQKLDQNTPYVQSVRNALVDASRDAPALEDAAKLRTQLDSLSQQLNRYGQLQARLDVLNTLRNRLETGDPQFELWGVKALQLGQKLDNLPPTDLNAHTSLQTEIEAAISELTKLVPASKTAETTRDLKDVTDTLFTLLLPPPSIALKLSEVEEESALTRLHWFTWISYGVALLLLASAGYSELYLARPTFGANGWSDYFVLLAWGFGIEATRAAVTQLVQGWGMLTPKPGSQ